MASFSQALNSDTKLVFVSLFAKGRFIAIFKPKDSLLKQQLLYFLKRRGNWFTRFEIISSLDSRR